MASVPSLAATVHQRVADALSAALPEAGSADPLLRRSDRADFQANGMLALAKKLKGNPRELASKVVAHLPVAATSADPDPVIADIEVSGPGFLNISIADSAITATLAARAADERLGVPYAEAPGTTVIDYAQPNVAKEMHVGHLRSAVIGDAVVRILEFAGEKVIRRHHIGDWGTQFGMLIQYLIEHPHELDHKDAASGQEAMSNLNRLYKAARALFDSDPEFKERSRRRVVDLQAGDEETIALWRKFVDESKIYFYSVFDKLDIEIRDPDVVGESGYNDMLAETCRLLEESGVAVRSEGALCVFFDDIKGPEGNPVPLIVQKSDGGFGYAATDLSAIRDRVRNLKADTLLYVVDARQSLHFKMVFETARRIGWLGDRVHAVQLAFGTVLGKDGKPFKTREGETVRLEDLLDEATERAAAVVREKSEKLGLTEEEILERGAQVGIGAVKYADLSTSASRDYKFDLDQMVSLNGDTSVYLQYAYARIQSILRRAEEGQRPRAHPELPLAPAERALGLHLDQFGETLRDVAAGFEPHKLAGYLYQLASLYTTFYDQCPVLKAEGGPAQVENRLFLCDITARTLRQGMTLLGIRTPERL
ncbi:arginine--tRNA ligase [Streptomyces hygroscopicus]|uniref:arginine--tRNA ligase n=1 Tax=Streptomyces hygroscopicus TaxID=1912 RepID=UPI0008299FDC|nr:arginine--tRNA ligase [Streptomyces hygroscopicus]GLV72025.1 arginine--tRNA ligase [Streptomyces hygroscopicus subsp. hygroscopicus]